MEKKSVFFCPALTVHDETMHQSTNEKCLDDFIHESAKNAATISKQNKNKRIWNNLWHHVYIRCNPKWQETNKGWPTIEAIMVFKLIAPKYGNLAPVDFVLASKRLNFLQTVLS